MSLSAPPTLLPFTDIMKPDWQCYLTRDEKTTTIEAIEDENKEMAFKKQIATEREKAVQKIQAIFGEQSKMTTKELVYAMALCNDNETEVLEKLSTDHKFIGRIRRRLIATGEQQDHASEEAALPVPSSFPVKRVRIHPSATTSSATSTTNNTSSKPSTYVRSSKSIRLDDALKDTTNMKGWSDARKNAFKKIHTNPNSYYYRFNAPGESQANGPWTNDEKAVFLIRLHEFREKSGLHAPQWGIFSMDIPGRVGYQCANFYRKLIKAGEVTDPAFKYDPVSGDVKLVRHGNSGGGRKKKKKKKKPAASTTTSSDPLDALPKSTITSLFSAVNKPKRKRKAAKQQSDGDDTEESDNERPTRRLRHA